jgi:hypothetical protein
MHASGHGIIDGDSARMTMVSRPLIALAVLLGIALAPAPVAAGDPGDLDRIALVYRQGDWRTTTPDGQWWDPEVAGAWRITRARRGPDGRLRLHVTVRPFPGSLGLDPGPAVLFGTVSLTGDAGSTGASVDIKPVAMAPVRACEVVTRCVYRAAITLPTHLVRRAAARWHGDVSWSSVDVSLTLVRTFAQGSWLQVVPGPFPVRRGGTLAQPRPVSSSTEVYGLFTPAQGRRWLSFRGPQNLAPVPIMRIVEASRLRARDRSARAPMVPVRLDIDPGDCFGWTLVTATGDVAFDQSRPRTGRVHTAVAVPAGTSWYIRAPSLESTSSPDDTVHTFGPFTASEGPFALTGSFSCRAATGDVEMQVGRTDPAPVEPERCLADRDSAAAPCRI